MPFITPAIAALIAGGVAGGTTLISAKMNSNASKNAVASQQQLANDAAARAKPAYDQAYNYYSGLLKGGDELQRAVEPERNAINQQFDSAKQSAVNNAYSRGGGLDKSIRTMEAGRAFSISDLYGKGRAAGASGLASLAGSDTAAAASLLAGANQTSAYNSLVQGQALQGLGSIFTRLLTTPGMFGQPSTPFSMPGANPGTPAAIAGFPGSLTGSPFKANSASLSGNSSGYDPEAGLF